MVLPVTAIVRGTARVRERPDQEVGSRMGRRTPASRRCPRPGPRRASWTSPGWAQSVGRGRKGRVRWSPGLGVGTVGSEAGSLRAPPPVLGVPLSASARSEAARPCPPARRATTARARRGRPGGRPRPSGGFAPDRRLDGDSTRRPSRPWSRATSPQAAPSAAEVEHLVPPLVERARSPSDGDGRAHQVSPGVGRRVEPGRRRTSARRPARAAALVDGRCSSTGRAGACAVKARE